MRGRGGRKGRDVECMTTTSTARTIANGRIAVRNHSQGEHTPSKIFIIDYHDYIFCNIIIVEDKTIWHQ